MHLCVCVYPCACVCLAATEWDGYCILQEEASSSREDCFHPGFCSPWEWHCLAVWAGCHHSATCWLSGAQVSHSHWGNTNNNKLHLLLWYSWEAVHRAQQFLSENLPLGWDNITRIWKSAFVNFCQISVLLFVMEQSTLKYTDICYRIASQWSKTEIEANRSFSSNWNNI